MALCSKGKELLRELQRSDWLSPYNDELMRQVIEEVGVLHDQISEKFRVFGDEINEHKSVQIGLIVNHQCVLRNKRCVLAYLHERAEKVKNLRWETGTIIPAHLASNLNPREIEFFHSYDQLLTDYMADFELDLTADAKPPKDLYVEVRVLQDCGEIMTENGLVNLEANSTHFLRRVDVEQLIRQGLLEQIRH